MIEYIGSGAYVPGIPKRDLTRREWDALSKEVQQRLIEQGIYRETGKSQSKKEDK